MDHDSIRQELRQIKWILAGILACALVITFAAVPELLPVAIFLAAAWIILWVIFEFFPAARGVKLGLQLALSNLRYPRNPR